MSARLPTIHLSRLRDSTFGIIVGGIFSSNPQRSRS
jgi:hypothetical protein